VSGSSCVSGQGGGVEVVVIICSEVKSSFRAALTGLLLDLVQAGGAIPSPADLVLLSGSFLTASSEALLHIWPCVHRFLRD